MDERGLALLRQLVSDVEGAPYPGVIDGELYTIWFEHAQSVVQEALEYLDAADPGHRESQGEESASLAELDA